MAIGFTVDKGAFEMKLFQGFLDMRNGFDKLKGAYDWLQNHPVENGHDPIVDWGYTAEEAAFVRDHVEEIQQCRFDNDALFQRNRFFTGVE